MIYLLIFVYMLAFPVIMITLLWRILDKLDKRNEQNEIKTNNVQRKPHPNIGKISYRSPLFGRQSVQAYEQYKNADGLYEPLKPNNGIPIKKED